MALAVVSLTLPPKLFWGINEKVPVPSRDYQRESSSTIPLQRNAQATLLPDGSVRKSRASSGYAKKVANNSYATSQRHRSCSELPRLHAEARAEERLARFLYEQLFAFPLLP